MIGAVTTVVFITDIVIVVVIVVVDPKNILLSLPPLHLPMPVGNRPPSLALAYARQMEGASENCAFAYARL